MAENQRHGRPERIGRYRVVDRIGRGAMGVVYSAHDELMGRDVAVKVMMTDLEGEPDIRARFMREAQVSAKLAHRIAREVEKAFAGDTSYSWSDDGSLLAVWLESRDAR